MPDSTGDKRHIIPAVSDLTTQEIRSAQRVVASNACDTEDCRRLLDMLGLLPQETT